MRLFNELNNLSSFRKLFLLRSINFNLKEEITMTEMTDILSASNNREFPDWKDYCLETLNINENVFLIVVKTGVCFWFDKRMLFFQVIRFIY